MIDNSDAEHDQLDNDISILYQQRKQATVPPTINFEKAAAEGRSSQRKNAVIKSLGILFSASFASFGIFAIITHLAIAPDIEETTNYEPRFVLIESAPIKNGTTPIQPEIPPMPPQPEKTIVAKTPVEEINLASLPKVEIDMPGRISTQASVTIPEISVEETQVAPSHKVMPSYPIGARKEKITGKVMLTYDVDAMGDVINIELVESPDTDTKKFLSHSAIKALKQWKFAELEQTSIDNHIVFEFQLDEK